jgi:RNA-binding protein
MESLPGPKIRKLKALAQRLEPVLRVGKAGLSDAFFKSLDEALAIHELVKVKFAEFKEEKKELIPQMAERTGSGVVMQVGHVVVLYRQNPNPEQRKVHF